MVLSMFSLLSSMSRAMAAMASMALLPSVSVRALAMASKAFCRFAPRSFTRTLLWYCAFISRASAHTALRSTAAFPFAPSRMARSCAFSDPTSFCSRSFSSTTRCISVMSVSTFFKEKFLFVLLFSATWGTLFVAELMGAGLIPFWEPRLAGVGSAFSLVSTPFSEFPPWLLLFSLSYAILRMNPG